MWGEQVIKGGAVSASDAIGIGGGGGGGVAKKDDGMLYQIAFFRSLICCGDRQNPATCGTNQGNRKRRFDPTLWADRRACSMLHAPRVRFRRGVSQLRHTANSGDVFIV